MCVLLRLPCKNERRKKRHGQKPESSNGPRGASLNDGDKTEGR